MSNETRVKRSYYYADCDEFLNASEEAILGELTDSHGLWMMSMWVIRSLCPHQSRGHIWHLNTGRTMFSMLATCH